MKRQTIEQRLNELILRCRSRKLSVTHQRLAVYRALLQSSNHPTTESIFELVRQESPTISLATVYKTLATLEQAGMVRKVILPQGSAARYDANLEHHHHLFCVKCHRVEDFYHSQLNGLTLCQKKAKGFQVIDLTLHVNGLCPACQEKTAG